ncbi:uncharacterized protein BP01DRAFT_408894 [Aspergillus saccharolyticus JOP 1030-1]|uniref:Zn(2)-C6 fungal-type domain-containing protein n=1 Tax=Aspergillus saccharolyticus JOP 1030-1 TaxID=1450539 RepID=A0A318ZBI0_9EURO|nr:hypothetical protein BP01DRAFT_408894 [Aspergillus saccharolyticus JOP 1030-1]PYH40820.1 hypothetical protein BP01DRAFT_408894 [Aspergillus saccharolyticus JOP 1030-1]
MPFKSKPVKVACNPCRERRVKCDGATPTCKTCEKAGKSCSYRQGDSRSTKAPVRVSLGVLVKRINQLVELIEAQGLNFPPMEESDHSIIQSVLDVYGVEYQDLSPCGLENSDSVPSLTKPVQEQTTKNSAHHAEEKTWSTYNLRPRLSNVASAPARSQRHSDFPITEPAPQPSFLPDIQVEDEKAQVTNQLSCRLGKLQVTHDGQLQYFGFSSNPRLLDSLAGVSPPCLTDIQKRAQEALENTKIAPSYDEAFEQHLLKLYFTWQDPCLHAVEERAFWNSRSQQSSEGMTTPYCSGTLINAMCAMGAAYEDQDHPHPMISRRSLAEFFGDRAKVLLGLELESPSLATVQALVILSEFEASCTRETCGWLYSAGMAMRLAFDLGLHLDMTPYVDKGIISSENAEVRRVTFWGVYMNEQFWGYYLGRPTRSPVEAITVKKLDEGNTSTATRWEPYGHMGLTTNTISILNPLRLLCSQWVSLYDLMLPLAEVLYGNSLINALRLHEIAADTVHKLNTWKTQLPAQLTLDREYLSIPPLPHVLALHMQYHQLLIHCHRPYISQGPGSRQARMTCIESAVSITKLLTEYRQHYTFQRANLQIVSSVFYAAVILFFSTAPLTNDDGTELKGHLYTCFRALDELGNQFESAKRTNTLLQKLQRGWQIHRRETNVSQGIKEKSPYPPAATSRRPITWDEGFSHPAGDSYSGSVAARRAEAHVDVDANTSLESPSGRERLPSAQDLLGSDLCSILLSEGISGAFV